MDKNIIKHREQDNTINIDSTMKLLTAINKIIINLDKIKMASVAAAQFLTTPEGQKLAKTGISFAIGVFIIFIIFIVIMIGTGFSGSSNNISGIKSSGSFNRWSHTSGG